jgi:uncharacterized protein YndB with AHSA1/START domain
MSTSTDRIEKEIQLRAPQSRVWQALTDHQEFGTWFQAILERPFAPGETSFGKITYPGYEHLTMELFIEKIEPQSYFSFRWHPYAVEEGESYANEPTTLVEFHLEPKNGGTFLRVTESGFDKVPAHRRDEAFRMNSEGWAEQLQNIKKHVGG